MLSRVYVLLLVVTFTALTVDGKPKANQNRVQNNGTVVTNNGAQLFESSGQKNISINGTNKIQAPGQGSSSTNGTNKIQFFEQGNFSTNGTNRTQSFGQRNGTQSSNNKRSFRQKREINSAWGVNSKNQTFNVSRPTGGINAIFNGTKPAHQGNNKHNGTRTLP